TQARADAITALGVAEPDGILRRMEKAVGAAAAAAPLPDPVAAFKANPTPLPLKGTVQHYDWGGFDFIPSFLGIDNAAKKPYAELWIGSHPGGPAVAQVAGGAPLTLAELAE